jgi:formyltetrahydrofolate deformylase
MHQKPWLLRCVSRDRIGILADVTSFLAARQLSIVESEDYADPDTRTFFIRVVLAPTEPGFDPARFRTEFGAAMAKWGMDWSLRPRDERPRVLILVSKFDHCLHDLLYRRRKGSLPMDVPAIISNHEDAAWHAQRHDIPFLHIPATPKNRSEAEARIREVISDTGTDLVVLARYMQILTPDFCATLEGRCINIHHSFLPSFKGAKPYHQAHARGVKLIGATAHYVTPDLDEGPIIAQAVEAIDHRDTPERLVLKGQDIEARVLADAVKAHVEGRIFLNGHKTVVFD